jgi:hypothetical protein
VFHVAPRSWLEAEALDEVTLLAIMPKKMKTIDVRSMEEVTLRFGITNQTVDGSNHARVYKKTKNGPIYNST